MAPDRETPPVGTGGAKTGNAGADNTSSIPTSSPACNTSQTDPLGNVPEALKARTAWVCWRYEERDGKPTKVPKNPRTGRNAKSNDARTWSTFADAVAAAERFDGLGIMFAEGLCGVDLDHCRDPKTGELEPWAAEVVAELDSYTEASPSGTGVHVLATGDLPEGRRRKGPVEVYGPGSPRYFTVTGEHLPGTPTTVNERTEALASVHARLIGTEAPQADAPPRPTEPLDLDDEELLVKARSARNGADFSRLWEGGYPEDDSAGDLALCSHLAFWCGGDAGRVDALFRRSGRYRPKWERADYRERTIAKALEGMTDFYTGPGGRSTMNTPHDEQQTAAAGAWNLTDVGNGQRLAARHGRDLRYCAPLATWFLWDGQRWRPDAGNAVRELGKATARSILVEAALIDDEDRRKAFIKHAFASERDRSLRAMLWCAETEPSIPVMPEELDADPWALNVLNGTLDLRTGELRPHRREDLLTHLCPVAYDPDARSELWEGFLERVTCGDLALQQFLQQVAGYALTGSTREEKLLFVYGPARSGKSTFLGALQATLGEDYSHTCDFEAFLKRKPTGGPKDDLANMAGKRLVVSVETDEGARLAEGLIKQLTGGDRVRARRLYANSIEFLPQFKLFLAANDRPKARDDDDALWERILEVPFPNSIPRSERNPDVKTALCDPARSGAAILAWAVTGCLAWQHDGLQVPQAVELSTASYRESQNPLKEFLAERCVLTPEAWTPSAAIMDAYRQWAQGANVRYPLTAKAVGDKLRALGCEQEQRGSGRTRGWRGIGLWTEREG